MSYVRMTPLRKKVPSKTKYIIRYHNTAHPTTYESMVLIVSITLLYLSVDAFID